MTQPNTSPRPLRYKARAHSTGGYLKRKPICHFCGFMSSFLDFFRFSRASGGPRRPPGGKICHFCDFTSSFFDVFVIPRAAARNIPQRRGLAGQKLGKNDDSTGRRPKHSSKKRSWTPQTGEKWRLDRPPPETFRQKGVPDAKNWGKVTI